MTNQHIQKFFEKYPGPFEYHRGSNGVDETFDVVCTTTDSHIIASHYWEAEAAAELTAQSVTFALNMLSVGETLLWSPDNLPESVVWLQTEYPGPYSTEFVECEFMPAHQVTCLHSQDCVIADYTRSDNEEGQLVAETVAAALNALRQPRLLDVLREPHLMDALRRLLAAK